MDTETHWFVILAVLIIICCTYYLLRSILLCKKHYVSQKKSLQYSYVYVFTNKYKVKHGYRNTLVCDFSCTYNYLLYLLLT